MKYKVGDKVKVKIGKHWYCARVTEIATNPTGYRVVSDEDGIAITGTWYGAKSIKPRKG